MWWFCACFVTFTFPAVRFFTDSLDRWPERYRNCGGRSRERSSTHSGTWTAPRVADQATDRSQKAWWSPDCLQSIAESKRVDWSCRARRRKKIRATCQECDHCPRPPLPLTLCKNFFRGLSNCRLEKQKRNLSSSFRTAVMQAWTFANSHDLFCGSAFSVETRGKFLSWFPVPIFDLNVNAPNAKRKIPINSPLAFIQIMRGWPNRVLHSINLCQQFYVEIFNKVADC